MQHSPDTDSGPSAAQLSGAAPPRRCQRTSVSLHPTHKRSAARTPTRLPPQAAVNGYRHRAFTHSTTHCGRRTVPAATCHCWSSQQATSSSESALGWAKNGEWLPRMV
jgi:hypothetical protein